MIPSKLKSSIFVILVLGLCFISAKFLFFANKNWLVKNIEFTSVVNFVDESEFEPILSRAMGQSILFTDINKLREKVLHLPWVRDVSIDKVWPDTLSVSIDEHVPMATLGKDRIVSSSGKTFLVNYLPNSGLPNFDMPPSKVSKAIDLYLSTLSRLKTVGLNIKSLKYSTKSGWGLVTSNDILLVIGHDDVDARVSRFVLAYDRKLKSLVGDIKYVELRYTNGVAVGWKTVNTNSSRVKG